MKLRNKKTGEIGYLHSDSDNRIQVARNTGYNYNYYDTLTELVEEWEDAPEPKEYLYIAKQTVEKLKALKRLRDKGFRFTGYSGRDREYIHQIEIYAEADDFVDGEAFDLAEDPDVKLLFGDEE